MASSPSESSTDIAAMQTALSNVTLTPGNTDDDGVAGFFAALSGEPPERVYHYTSAAGLHGILTQRELWASHTRFLNDTTEGIHGLARCTARLRARAGAHKVFTDAVTTLLERAANDQDDWGFDRYVVCFSDDGDIIPQWRGYGADGAGYALGFDLIPTAMATDTSPLRVIYSEEEQNTLLDAAIDGYVAVLERSLAAHPQDRNGVAQAVGLTLTSVLTQLSACFKNEMFAYEREWRLVQFLHRGKSDPGVKYRAARGVIVPFRSFTLGPDAPLPISEIRCGPMNAQDIGASGVDRFAKSLGVSCTITRSSAPLRF